MENQSNIPSPSITESSAISSSEIEGYVPLDKAPSEMTPEELAQRNAEVTKRQINKKVQSSSQDKAPWPTYEEQESLAQKQVQLNTDIVNSDLAKAFENKEK